MKSSTAPSRTDPVVVFPLCQWCPPQETSQPHPLQLKVTTWVQHSINSHPFRSMSIGHPIPEIWHFQNLTLKIQDQGHGWCERWKSQHGSSILSTHILLWNVNQPFHSCDTKFSKFDLENPRWRWNDNNVAQLQVLTIPYNYKWHKSIQRFQRYGFHKVWPKCCLIWQVLGNGQAHIGQITMTVHNYKSREVH